MKTVFPGQSGYNGVAEIGKARQNRIESMRRQVCANGVGMSDIEEHGCYSRETEVLDEPLGSVEANVTKTDLIVAAFRQETGNQGSDLPSTQDEHTLHGGPHLRSVYSRPSTLRKTFLHTRTSMACTSSATEEQSGRIAARDVQRFEV